MEGDVLTPYWQDSHSTILQGDAREALRGLPERSVHACITSPPYWGLRDYGLEPVVWGGDGCPHETIFQPLSNHPLDKPY